MFSNLSARQRRLIIGKDRSAGGALLVLTFLTLLSLMAYTAGLTAIRYNHPDTEEFKVWVYWEYWLSSWMIMIVAMYAWVVKTSFRGSWTNFGFLFTCVVVMCWYIAHMVFDIIELKECNKLNDALEPDHPHCYQRMAPHDKPDVAFILTFSAGLLDIILCGLFFIYGLIIRSITDIEQSAFGNKMSQSLEEPNDQEKQLLVNSKRSRDSPSSPPAPFDVKID
jgi:hypothetical protein